MFVDCVGYMLAVCLFHSLQLLYTCLSELPYEYIGTSCVVPIMYLSVTLHSTHHCVYCLYSVGDFKLGLC